MTVTIDPTSTVLLVLILVMFGTWLCKLGMELICVCVKETQLEVERDVSWWRLVEVVITGEPICPIVINGCMFRFGWLVWYLPVQTVSKPVPSVVDHDVLNLGQVLVLPVLVQQEVHSVVLEQQDVGT